MSWKIRSLLVGGFVIVVTAVTFITNFSAVKPQIYLGSLVNPGQYIATVGITYIDSNGTVEQMPRCSGTLIKTNAVLSAGHCACEALAKGYSVNSVVFGDDPARKTAHPKLAYFPVKKWWARYSCDTPANRDGADLLVLQLDRNVAGVDPVGFAQAPMHDGVKSARIVGFGATNAAGNQNDYRKREATVPVTSESCSSDRDQSKYKCAKGKEIVAGLPHASDTCSGDSGGPLLVSRNGDEVTVDGNDLLILGVTSRAVPGGKSACGVGGIYERIDDNAQKWLSEREAAFL